MPFLFSLPTTSSFTFSANFSCSSHPSLPLTASTYRAVVREVLKAHKHLPPPAQPANLTLVISAVNNYLPYLFVLEAGLSGQKVHNTVISVDPVNPPLKIEWRPTMLEPLVGRRQARVNISSLHHEISLALLTLGMAYSLQARDTLQPLFVTSMAPLGAEQRTDAMQTATLNLLDSASIFAYLSSRGEYSAGAPCLDATPAVASSMASLALAEATLLVVLKEDPYPVVLAQERNVHDREWMYKPPTVPRVRAHLLARLCLAACDHAAKAHSLCVVASRGHQKVDHALLRYMDDLRHTARARACRFFGIDSDLEGQTGTAIAWLHAGLGELGITREASGDEKKKGLSLGRFKREWSKKKEDKKVERSGHWGADAGKNEEIGVLEMLETKWTKANNTVQ